MANPIYEQSTIKKMKAPGVAITGKDTAVLSEVIGVHNATPPSLADGDFKQLQLDDLGNLKTTIGDPSVIPQLSGAKGALSNQSLVSVSSTPVKVSLSTDKVSMIIQNAGTKIIYIGGVGVSSSSFAFKIVPTQMIDFGAVKSTFSFYAACDGAETSSISVGEYA